jgi:hypothetical protein
VIVGPHPLFIGIEEVNEDAKVLVDLRRVFRDHELVRYFDRTAERNTRLIDVERRCRDGGRLRLLAPAGRSIEDTQKYEAQQGHASDGSYRHRRINSVTVDRERRKRRTQY